MASLSEGANRLAPIHAAPLMGWPCVISLEVVVEHSQHLLNNLKQGAGSLEPEIFVEQGAMMALTDPIWLGGQVRGAMDNMLRW